MNLANRKIEEVSQEIVDPLDKYNSLIHILKGHEEFTLNKEGIIISSNLEAVNITGYEEHEVIGKPISLFYHKGEKEKAISDLDKAARFKQSVVTGIRLKKRDTAFWARMKITALYDEQNKFIDHRFTRYIVKKITGLQDAELDTFMVRFRPSYTFTQYATDYEFYDYIKLAFEDYQLHRNEFTEPRKKTDSVR